MTQTPVERPKPCHFCKSDGVITTPNDRARCGVEMGHPGAEAFYCHCEGCGADGPVGDFHREAIDLWNAPAQEVSVQEAAKVLGRDNAVIIVRAIQHRCPHNSIIGGSIIRAALRDLSEKPHE